VLLEFHLSELATGYDVGMQTNAANAAALGRKAGAFAERSGTRQTPRGVSTYDLVFNDVSDRDAGYQKYVYGQSGAFWDRRNRRLPNFHRWERYIAAVREWARRPVFVWQIPLGNQYFRSMNNSFGHYQDNRAEYFFHHIRELRDAGIVALLFGAGNDGNTRNIDATGDGVTNPSQICTHDGTSGKARCTSHRSTVADDDGGYLRMAARNYYRSPVGLS
jgi:hypothetical protein